MSKTVYLDSPRNPDGQEILEAILSTVGLESDWCGGFDPISAIVINGNSEALEALRTLEHVATLLTAVHQNPAINAHVAKRLLSIGNSGNFVTLTTRVGEWQRRGVEDGKIDQFLDIVEEMVKSHAKSSSMSDAIASAETNTFGYTLQRKGTPGYFSNEEFR